MFSASSEARDRNAPTNANQIRLQTSRIGQEHRPIRYQLSARLSFRQGQGDPPFFRNYDARWQEIEEAAAVGRELLRGLQSKFLKEEVSATGVRRGVWRERAEKLFPANSP